MVLALALSGVAAPAALAEDQVTSVLTPSSISGPEEWSAANDAATEALDSAKAAIEASKAAGDIRVSRRVVSRRASEQGSTGSEHRSASWEA